MGGVKHLDAYLLVEPWIVKVRNNEATLSQFLGNKETEASGNGLLSLSCAAAAATRQS